MSVSTPIQSAQIKFNEYGTPVSDQFDDVYFSNQDGLAECQYVFLKQNHLMERWHTIQDKPFAQTEFHIAETGFGTGLNFLATWALYHSVFNTVKNKPKLIFTSFEKYPLIKSDLRMALQQWPQFNEFYQQLLLSYPEQLHSDSEFVLESGDICLRLLLGDVNQRISELTTESLQADAWFLDGFAPSKNPDMWTQHLFNNMARLTAPNGTVATFTAAGFVRRGLIQAGFAMTKHKGYGVKREMLAGQMSRVAKP